MLPALVVLCLVVFSKAIESLGEASISGIIWQLYMKIGTSHKLKERRELQKKLIKVRGERSSVSIKDNFAKWARLDREHNALKDQLENSSTQLSHEKQLVSQVVSAVVYLSTSGLLWVLRIKYRKVPAFWLPKNVFPYYAQWVFSLMFAPLGSLSMLWWIFIVTSSIASLKMLIGTAIAMIRQRLPSKSKVHSS